MKLTCHRHFGFLNLAREAVLTGEIIKDDAVWDFKMWLLAILTGDRINKGFFYKKLYSRFAGTKKVAVISR